MIAAAQTPLVTVHKNMFVPIPTPETEVVVEARLVIEPLPPIRVQSPVPAVGVEAESAAVDEQITWLLPASAGPGKLLTMMLRVDWLGGHEPLAMVHISVFVPDPNPNTAELDKVVF